MKDSVRVPSLLFGVAREGSSWVEGSVLEGSEGPTPVPDEVSDGPRRVWVSGVPSLCR